MSMRLVAAICLAICVACLSLTATAQTIGNYVLWPDRALDTNRIIIGTRVSLSYVDLSGPAPANATIRDVTFRASVGLIPCNDAVKIKFFRRELAAITVVAERGPFTVTGPVTKVSLTPPVEVQAGDLIGITFLQDCGGGGVLIGPIGHATTAEGSALILGDPAGSYALYPTLATLPVAQVRPTVALSIFGTDGTVQEIRSQVIVVAGAAGGVGGSRFKTDIQLATVPLPRFIFNPPLQGDVALGRLVYHAAESSGTTADVSVPFKLNRGESRTFSDFVGTLGLSGIGSIDVYTTLGFEPPMASAHIYEDSAGSTKGLTLDAEPLHRALSEEAVLFAPTDPSRFRMNIGVRTLDQAVNLELVVVRANGTAASEPVLWAVPANFFAQRDARQLLGITAFQPGDTIVVSPGGPVFVYGSIIDNVSQDPSVHFARVPR
jgi:hypothetical protein